MLKRWSSIAVLCLIASACSNSPTEPGSASLGTSPDISGAWTGTFASSNNVTESMTVDLSKSGSQITGTWRSTTVDWNGQVTGTVSGSSFNGQMTFNGRALDETICTGTAAVVGSAKTEASSTTLSWTSPAGVVGGSCPAPLPINVVIDLHR